MLMAAEPAPRTLGRMDTSAMGKQTCSDVSVAAALPVNGEAEDVSEALEDFINNVGVSVRSKLRGHHRLFHG